MEKVTTGLNLVLGKVLSQWCDLMAPQTLDRYLETGGFQGLARAQGMSSPEAVAELRNSGLRDHRLEAEPVYLAWQRFQHRHEEGVLVVDATQYDPRSRSGAYLLSNNPFGLAEGLLTASAILGVRRAEVLLPAFLQEHETTILNTMDEVARRGLDQGRGLDVSLVRNALPGIRFHQGEQTAETARLTHRLETWYHLALVFFLGANRYRNVGFEGQAGTWLMTMGGEVRHPGVVEAPLGCNLWQAVESLTGGVTGESWPLGLSLDDGMGGFLTPEASHLPLAPEEFTGAGVTPSPSTVWVMPQGACVVDLTRRALFRYWRLSDEGHRPSRAIIARAARMVTEITRGKAKPTHIDDLLVLSREMANQGLAAAWPLYSSLTYFREEWKRHVEEGKCPADICLERRPAPCHATCPAGIDIPSFLAHIGHGRYQDSTRIITRDNPLPYVCGLVCPAPCEGACVRGEMDAPIYIRAMKAVASRHTLEELGSYPKWPVCTPNNRRVAVVGSGPAGLTAAYYLALMGYAVEVFEAQEAAGGMLRYGIPAYRLPREVLDKEVAEIAALGVAIHTGREIKNIDELKAQGFEAVFLALGTQISRLIPIEGVHLPFVLGGIDFLKEVRGDKNPQVGPRVVVVGGGNVAIDVALSAARQGGKRVDMVCLEKRREMPAHESEVETALLEGVGIHNSWGPVSINPDNTVTFQRCTRVFDERGRFSPQFDPENRLTLEADHVILAIGQATDLACVEEGSTVEVARGLICADPGTLSTRETGVFAGGDVVHGPRTVVEAIRSGKRAALSIDSFFTGLPLREDLLEPTRRDEVEPVGAKPFERTNLRRSEMTMRRIEDRKGNFQHIELGLSDGQAHNEAARCLRCDLCIGCGLCQLVCSEVGAEALRLGDTKADRLAFNDYTRPEKRCIGCGACAQACPTGAIRVVDRDGVRRTVITGTVVREHELTPCSVCGEPFMPEVYLNNLKHRVDARTRAHVEETICPECARMKKAREIASFPTGPGIFA